VRQLYEDILQGVSLVENQAIACCAANAALVYAANGNSVFSTNEASSLTQLPFRGES
jgi:hypothetical protein